MGTVKEMIREYLDDLPINSIFSMRDICSTIYMRTAGKRNPLDGSVGRMVREIRTDKELSYDIICEDRPKALYKKIKKDID